MKSYREIIPVSVLLDEELNAVRGGAADNTVADCIVGKKGDIVCDIGRVSVTPATPVKDLIALP